MRALAPKEYASLPKLDAPAGYICVLRDIGRDAYRIDSTDHPQAYVDALLGDITGSYGIELISILQADELAVSESALYDAHHARLSDEWLKLDAYQLRALRKSELRILEHNSYYISQPQPSPADAAKRARSLEGLPETRESRREEGDAPSPLFMENDRVFQRRTSQRKAPEPQSWRQTLSDKTDDFMHNHPGLVIAIILLAMLLLLIHCWDSPYAY